MYNLSLNRLTFNKTICFAPTLLSDKLLKQFGIFKLTVTFLNRNLEGNIHDDMLDYYF